MFQAMSPSSTEMVDDKGKPCTVYLYFNKEKQRPETSLDDPRLATKITPSNESNTQLAVNNDGKTQEATKRRERTARQGSDGTQER